MLSWVTALVRHRRPGRAAPGSSGFTLIETLIVVSVIGVGLAVALPSVRTIIVRQHVDRAAQIIASDVRSAFTSSARGRVPVRMVIPTSTTKYTITNRATGDTIIRRDFGTGDISVGALTGTTLTMDVYPNGVATGVDTITVSMSGYSRKVSVSRVGFVRVLP